MTMASPAVLAARANLAYATLDLCGVYLDMIQRCGDAEERGEAMDANHRAVVIHERHADAVGAFIAAWQRGPGYDANLRVAQTAIRGFVDHFDIGDAAKAAGERMLLDYVKDRATALDRLRAERLLADPRLGALPERLSALMRAYEAEGYCASAPAVSAAVAAVRAAIADALEGGADPQQLQIALDRWSIDSKIAVTLGAVQVDSGMV